MGVYSSTAHMHIMYIYIPFLQLHRFLYVSSALKHHCTHSLVRSWTPMGVSGCPAASNPKAWLTFSLMSFQLHPSLSHGYRGPKKKVAKSKFAQQKSPQNPIKIPSYPSPILKQQNPSPQVPSLNVHCPGSKSWRLKPLWPHQFQAWQMAALNSSFNAYWLQLWSDKNWQNKIDPQNWLIGFCWNIVANQKEKKPATCHPLLHFDAGAAHQEVLLSASVAVPKGHCALRHKFTMTVVSDSEFLGNIENMFFRFCMLIFLKLNVRINLQIYPRMV